MFRNIALLLIVVCIHANSPLLNGSEATIIFVNNTNTSFGDGSLENPYNTLKAAEVASSEGEIIFVFAGDGTSYGLDTGFRLKDNQSLIGCGLPKITNVFGNTIELASTNEVCGLEIYSTNGWGIHGKNISNTKLIGNSIKTCFSVGGIGLFNVSDLVYIQNSNIQNEGLSHYGGIGIQIENHGENIATAILKSNTVGNFLAGIGIFTFDGSEIISTLTENDVSNPVTSEDNWLN